MTASALGWLAAQRKACADSHIFLVVPFGGFKRAALATAFADYQKQQQQVDTRAHFVDLGAAATQGLERFSPGSTEAADGIHPLAVRGGQLGAMLGARAAVILAQQDQGMRSEL